MLTKTVHGSLEVKEVIQDQNKIAELEQARLEIKKNEKPEPIPVETK